MNKILIALTAGCISMSALSNSTYAQSTGNVFAFTDTKTFVNSVQTIDVMYHPISLLTVNSPEVSNVNMKAIKDFKERFSTANDEKWYTVPGGFMAYFKIDGFGDRAFYDKKGHWRYSLSFFNEDGLPREIRTIVKSTYFDYSITLVEQVETTKGGVYLVHLEDKTTIKIVRVTKDGEMDVMQEFTKA